MQCKDCKYMYNNETMGNLYLCTNGNSSMLGEFVGICCSDECEDGESEDAE